MSRVLNTARSPHAFTLMEVLVSIALLTLLGGAMFGFLSNLAGRRADLAILGRQAQATETFLDRLETDLLAAVASDPKHGSGLRGSRNSIELLTRQVTLDLSAPHLGDLQRASYKFSEGEQALRAERADLVSAPRVRSDADGYGERAPVTAPTTGGSEIVLEGIERLEFQYHNGRNWRHSFDSGQAGRFPLVVEVSIWFARAGESETAEQSSESLSPEVDAEDADDLAAWEAEIFGEEHEDVRTSFDVADMDEQRRPADRRRVVVIPQAGGPDSGRARRSAGNDASTSPPLEADPEVGGR